ncbi:MAG TPA: hypothetical protein ENO29_01305 [Candidatus Aminicenantes bacterium]|nr:hypothetical protein [Candidatus Aminicenantes bacterium]
MKKICFVTLSIIFVLLIQNKLCFSQTIRLIDKIPIEENSLLVSGSFVVLENGNFIFADIKDENNQFKIINEKGKIIKAWGKMGPGPGEFGGVAYIDYQFPFLAAFDAGKKCVHVFEANQDEFQKKYEILAWEADSFIKIYNGNVLMEGYIVSPKERKYIIFKRDFLGKNIEYILPLEYRYGGKSQSEYEKTREGISGVSYRGATDIYGDTLFYVSDVRLKIIKIDMKTGKIEIFGKEPRNFHSLVIDQKTRNEFLNPQTGRKVIEEILNKFSFVGGIFADKDFVGVIYLNREKKVQSDLYFVAYFQIYDHSGKLLDEGQLKEFYSEEKYVPLFYQKEAGYLYLLAWISNESSLKYMIYKYQIKL